MLLNPETGLTDEALKSSRAACKEPGEMRGEAQSWWFNKGGG